jgi:hypothetical protein
VAQQNAAQSGKWLVSERKPIANPAGLKTFPESLGALLEKILASAWVSP